MKQFILVLIVVGIVAVSGQVYAVKLSKIGSCKGLSTPYTDTNRNGQWDEGEPRTGLTLTCYWAVPSYSQTGVQIQAGRDGDGNWFTKDENNNWVKAQYP